MYHVLRGDSIGTSYRQTHLCVECSFESPEVSRFSCKSPPLRNLARDPHFSVWLGASGPLSRLVEKKVTE